MPLAADKSSGADCGGRRPGGGARIGPRFRREGRPHARRFCRINDVHRRLAGGAGCHEQQGTSIGYSIAYPFGVIGPILCIYFMTQYVKPKFPPKTPHFHMAEISLGEHF